MDKKVIIKTSTFVQLGDDNKIKLSPNGFDNIITLKGEEFQLKYLGNKKGNKGGNSSVFKLTIPDEEDYDEEAIVIKISRISITGYRNKFQQNRLRRFQREIIGLRKSKVAGLSNVIEIFHYGEIEVQNKIFLFYTMEKADSDLTEFLKIKRSLQQKVFLFSGILDGIKQLHKIGIYHRDIKHDNIFIKDGNCKIGDLGLISFRNEDEVELDDDQKIGAFGWETPEAMNRLLTENVDVPEYDYDCFIDEQSDIFQVGKLFWYILQGNLPIGCLAFSDFRIQENDIYEFLLKLLQHSKQESRRPKTILEVEGLLKPIATQYFAA